MDNKITLTISSNKTPSAPSAASPSYPKGSLNAALALAGPSGALHSYIGIVVFGLPSGIALILIALVYFGGVGLVAANYKRDLLLKVGLGWVVLVIILWASTAAAGLMGTRDPLAFVDKAIEFVLLGLLLRIRMALNRPIAIP